MPGIFVRVLVTLEIFLFGARGCVTGALVRRSPEHARCASQRIVVAMPLSHPLPPLPRSEVSHPLREKEKELCERARGGSPKPTHTQLYISSLSSRSARHIQFLTGATIEVTRPRRSRLNLIITHVSRDFIRRIDESGRPGLRRVHGVSTGGDNSRDRDKPTHTHTHTNTHTYAHTLTVRDVARDSHSLEAIDPRNRNDSVTPVWDSCESYDNKTIGTSAGK